MTKNWDLVTLTAAVGCGAMGGVLFAFSAFVMSGLARLPHPGGLDAMKSINVTAERPPLMIALLGSAALCVALVWRAISNRGEPQAWLLLTGATLYLVGTVILTIVYNVPLNNRLATVSSTAPDAVHQWHEYVRHWTLANHIRTASALAAMVVLVIAFARGQSARTSESAAQHHVVQAWAARSAATT